MDNSNIFINISENSLNISDLYNFCISPEAGAIVCFGGTTRNNFENKSVVSLEYESYKEYALQNMKDICDEIISRGALKVAMTHRIGNVPVGETSVFCIVSTGHRPEGFELCRYAIDTLKQKVTIWKKEIYTDSNYTWKENVN